MREQTTSIEENTVQARNKGNWIERAVSQHFTVLLTVLALIGGATAMFLPLVLCSAGQVDSNLRLHILYMTGGIIAVLGLVETHRKNTVDREKAEVEKENYEKMQAHQASVLDEQQRQFNVTMDQEREKIEADKAKNEQDYIRQVHAERRSRYTTAIEQLSSDKASIRLGGVYTLVGLVDEWLADEKTISNIEECRKEGQTIINNLCAYIRSSFPLAKRYKELTLSYEEYQESHTKNSLLEIIYSKGNNQPLQSYKEFINDKSIFKEEQEIRKTIITEIRSHLFIRKSEGEFTRKFGDEEYTSGPWSKFIFDFSNSDFFYTADFSKSFFQQKDISFESSIFRDRTLFNHATFGGDVDFRYVYFLGFTNFSNTYFTEHPSFIKAKINVESKYNDWNFARGNGAACVGTYTPNLNGISREIPSEAVLYDISSGEQTNFFTGKQEHPKHLKESKIHKLFETFKKII